MDSLQSDLCRVTVLAPSVRIDVALPADVPLADLLPTLLLQAGEDRPDPSGVPALWSLQRFGESGLDIARTATALALRDGEILYLRPRDAELPPMTFDDVADAIATGSRNRPHWDDRDTRRAGFVATVLGFTSILAVLVSGVMSRPGLALASAAFCLILLAATPILSRALQDARAAAVTGYAATAFAAVAAAAAFAGDTPDGARVDLLRGQSVLAAAGAALLVAVLAALAIGVDVPGFVGLATAAGLTTAGGLLQTSAGLTSAQAAAVTATAALALTPLIPGVALRAARIPLPTIPTSAADVRADTGAVPGAEVLRRTQDADRLVSALVGALAGILAGGCVVLATDRRAVAVWLVAALTLAGGLRSRAFTGRVQRSALLAAAAVGALALALSGAAGQDGLQPYLVLTGLTLALIVALAVGVRRPDQRLSPVWRSVGDVLEAIVVLSIIPLTLAVLGVYGYVRGVTGG